MHAATIRRSIVFVVCAVGVGCLYLAPGLARSPDQVGATRPDDEPTARPTGRSVAPSATPTDAGPPPSTGPTAGTARTTSGDAPTPTPPASALPTSYASTGARPTATTAPTATARPTRRGPTAYDPDDTTDREPPQPVPAIKTVKVTADQLGLSWAASRDNVRVVGYHIWLNGFEVASTAETHASVRWFNDDTDTHVVRVLAVDEAGNESESSPTVLVTRPEPDPSTPAPEPTEPGVDPSPGAGPTDSDEPESETNDEPADAEPTAEPSGA